MSLLDFLAILKGGPMHNHTFWIGYEYAEMSPTGFPRFDSPAGAYMLETITAVSERDHGDPFDDTDLVIYRWVPA